MKFISSFSEQGYHIYGKKFLEAYKEHCNIPLVLYLESEIEEDWMEKRDMFAIPGIQDFLSYVRDLNGFQESDKYNYNLDVFKFCRKVFVLYDALHSCKDIAGWIDADVIFKKDIPNDFLKTVLDGKYVAYLGRKYTYPDHPECGFMSFDCSQRIHQPFMSLYLKMYTTGAFMNMKTQCDSSMFGHILSLLMPPANNLVENIDVNDEHVMERETNPFEHSILNEYMTHKKGPKQKYKMYKKLVMTGERQIAENISGIKPNHIKRYEFAINEIKKEYGDVANIHILDSACGVGYGTMLLAEAFPNAKVMGVDRCEDTIATAQRAYKRENNNFAKLDLDTEWPFPKDSFDVIVSIETIEHVKNDKLLIDNYVSTAPVLIGSVPNEDVVPFDKEKYPFHERHYTKQEFIDLLNGFSVKSWGTQYNKIPGDVSYSDDGMGFIVRAVREDNRLSA